MPTNYEWGLFFHIIGVFGIAGAASAAWVALIMLRRVGTAQELRSWAAAAVWVDRAFPVASLVVLVAGAYLVQEYDMGWGTGWINTSLIALVVMGAGGALLITPRLAAIRKAADAAPDGAATPELRRLTTDPVLWGTMLAFTGGLLAVLWNMTTKPGDAQAGAVVVLGFVVGAASVLPIAARE